MQTREHALQNWLQQAFPQENIVLSPLKGDASFRSYFRLTLKEQTYIIMDAPPAQESLDAFLKIQAYLEAAQVCVPKCFQVDQTQGFLVLSDFGDRLLLYSLTPENTDMLYQKAIDTLIQLQSIPQSEQSTLPAFNEQQLDTEFDLFKNWFLQKYLGLALTKAEAALLDETHAFLKQVFMTQPQVFIHRDYHSRNIMCLQDEQLGLIDFQDAMIGPWTYDLASLIKDCYIQWPKGKQEQWLSYFYHKAPLAHLQPYSHFVQDFELCGLQRHLKVLGIFSRLILRDKKVHFSNDLPLALQYVMTCLEAQPQLNAFLQFMQSRVQLPC